MNQMLASVTSVQEAEIVMKFDVDIVDIKNPADGALGAQPLHQVRRIVNYVDGRRLTSATIGDVEASADNLHELIIQMSETGVDFVKVGLFDKNVNEQFLKSMKQAIAADVSIVVVLFAEDYQEESSLIPLLDIGLRGVMIDTRLKNNIGLCDILNIETLEHFTDKARSSGLLTGLAGSIRQENIPGLMSCYADYIGFRGALCEANQRIQAISESAIKHICDTLKNNKMIPFNENNGLKQAI